MDAPVVLVLQYALMAAPKCITHVQCRLLTAMHDILAGGLNSTSACSANSIVSQLLPLVGRIFMQTLSKLKRGGLIACIQFFMLGKSNYINAFYSQLIADSRLMVMLS
jgi:hypothetical protein